MSRDKAEGGAARQDTGGSAPAAPVPGRTSASQHQGGEGEVGWENLDGKDAGKDAANNPDVVPAQFAHLPKPLIKTLHASQDTLHEPEHPWSQKQKPFWEKMQELSVHHLHTVCEVHREAEKAGLWGSVDKLTEIYTYSTSWGIHFLGSRPAIDSKSWGYDDIQYVVAREHSGEKSDGHAYDWYRQNTGAGNKGLHLGVGTRAKDHNLHVDPTNPMSRVSLGEEIPIPMAGDLPTIPTLHLEKGWKPTIARKPLTHFIPLGHAIYSPTETIEHVKEIWGVKKPGPNADMTKIYIEMFYLDEAQKHAQIHVERELSVRAQTINVSHSDLVVGQLQTTNAKIHQMNDKARGFAQLPDDQAHAAMEAMLPEIRGMRTLVFRQMAAMIAHMKRETPEVASNGLEDEAKWKHHADGYPVSDAMVKARAAKPRVGG